MFNVWRKQKVEGAAQTLSSEFSPYVIGASNVRNGKYSMVCVHSLEALLTRATDVCFKLGIRMRKGLTYMVWWYFHSCAVLNFTDSVSSINHSLAGGELSLLLHLAVSSALYVLPSV